jgi:hypothetical protein
VNFDLSVITANVAGVIAAWTTVCAMVSLANKYFIAPNFPKFSKGIGAVLSILPGHVGQLITDVEAIIADIKNPPADPGSSSTAPPATPPPPPPANQRGRIGLAGIGAVMLFSLQMTLFGAAVGCGGTIPSINVAPGTPGDIVGAVSCVVTALLANQSVQPCIDKYGQALIDDAFQTLLDSKEFAAAHPNEYSTLKVHAAQGK